jgi:Helix-turn-helix domain
LSVSFSRSQRELLLPAEAAERLKLALGTLAKMRLYGTGPPFLKFGRSVRYEAVALDEWMNGRRATSTSDTDRLPRRLTARATASGQKERQTAHLRAKEEEPAQ